MPNQINKKTGTGLRNGKEVFVEVRGLEHLASDAAQLNVYVGVKRFPRGPKLVYPIHQGDLSTSLELPLRKAIGFSRTRRVGTIEIVAEPLRFPIRKAKPI